MGYFRILLIPIFMYIHLMRSLTAITVHCSYLFYPASPFLAGSQQGSFIRWQLGKAWILLLDKLRSVRDLLPRFRLSIPGINTCFTCCGKELYMLAGNLISMHDFMAKTTVPPTSEKHLPDLTGAWPFSSFVPSYAGSCSFNSWWCCAEAW